MSDQPKANDLILKWEPHKTGAIAVIERSGDDKMVFGGLRFDADHLAKGQFILKVGVAIVDDLPIVAFRCKSLAEAMMVGEYFAQKFLGLVQGIKDRNNGL